MATVKEFTILPKNGVFYLELSYEVKPQTHQLDPNWTGGKHRGNGFNVAYTSLQTVRL